MYRSNLDVDCLVLFLLVRKTSYSKNRFGVHAKADPFRFCGQQKHEHPQSLEYADGLESIDVGFSR